LPSVRVPFGRVAAWLAGRSKGWMRQTRRNDFPVQRARDLPVRATLGCGVDYRAGWHSVDVRAATNPDEVVDLDETPWLWPEDAFRVVEMNNVPEHLAAQLAALRELHRVVETGGRSRVAYPHSNSRGMWIDPTHEHAVHPKTFEHELVPPFESSIGPVVGCGSGACYQTTGRCGGQTT